MDHLFTISGWLEEIAARPTSGYRSTAASAGIPPVLALEEPRPETGTTVFAGGTSIWHCTASSTCIDVDIDTLGGYLQYIHDAVPVQGDIIQSEGYSFEILEMEGQSIEKVKLNILSKKRPNAAA